MTNKIEEIKDNEEDKYYEISDEEDKKLDILRLLIHNIPNINWEWSAKGKYFHNNNSYYCPFRIRISQTLVDIDTLDGYIFITGEGIGEEEYEGCIEIKKEILKLFNEIYKYKWGHLEKFKFLNKIYKELKTSLE